MSLLHFIKRKSVSASVFQVEAFDVRAAVELAIITAKALKAGDKKAGSTASMAKMEFDRQIIAIANVNGASLIYTNDNNLAKFAESRGIEAIALWDLPVPPEDPQMDFLAVVEMDEAPEPEAEDDQDDGDEE